MHHDKEEIKRVDRERTDDNDAPEGIAFTDWSCSCGWVKIGKRYKGRRASKDSSTSMSGLLFLTEAGQNLLDTVFIHGF